MNNKENESTNSNGSIKNNKFLMIISTLIVLGIITGYLISIYYIDDANKSIENWNENMDSWNERWSNWSTDNNTLWNTSWNSNTTHNHSNHQWDSTNHSWNSSLYDPYLKKLSFSDVLLPTISCMILSTVSYILLALIVVYIKIYNESKSKYIQGILFVLVPLLIFSCFLIRVIKSLYFSSALTFNYINIIFGFGIDGLGFMIIVLTFFEIIGLSLLLRLSMQ